jgi:hypothetical protein
MNPLRDLFQRPPRVPQAYSSELELPLSVSEETFQLFVDAQKGIPVDPEPAMWDSLLFLTSHYQTTALHQTLCSHLAKLILATADLDLPTWELEQAMKQHFRECPDDDLLNIPVNVFQRIFCFPCPTNFEGDYRSAFNRTFDILILVFNRYSKHAPQFLPSLCEAELNEDQKRALGDSLRGASQATLNKLRVVKPNVRVKKVADLECTLKVVPLLVICVFLIAFGLGVAYAKDWANAQNPREENFANLDATVATILQTQGSFSAALDALKRSVKGSIDQLNGNTSEVKAKIQDLDSRLEAKVATCLNLARQANERTIPAQEGFWARLWRRTIG